MKKIKLFATVSVLCLGIAAIGNTQSHAKTIIDAYQDNGTGHCTKVVSQACSSGNNQDCVDGNGNPLYQYNNGPCIIQLSKK